MADDVERYVNTEVTAKMTADQFAAVGSALADWCDSHKNDPEAQAMIADIQSVEFVRTR